jgi:branched-chain amino acid transport system substrate-binding protein
VKIKMLGQFAIWLLANLIAVSGHAQILIGQTAGFTGPAAAGVTEITQGAKLYLDAVNARGGIHGQRIELVSLDDQFDPKLSAENAQKLITEHNVVALFLTRGTPHTQALLPLLDQYGIALVGPSTGAMVLHNPVHRHVFNVRATYQREAEKAIAHLTSIGINKVAVLYANDSFGNDGVIGAQKGLAASRLQPVVLQGMDRNKPDFASIAPQIAATQAQAVVIIASANAVAAGIDAIRKAGSTAQIVTLSNNASSGFIKGLGALGAGVIVSQVFPKSLNVPMVKEASDLGRSKNLTEVSPAMLEGYASAKVLVEALRRCAGTVTRERLQAALDNLGRFDLGGLEIRYTSQQHSGLDFVDLSIISSNGKFVR